MKILSKYLIFVLIGSVISFTAFAKENSSKMDITIIDSGIIEAMKQNNNKEALILAIGEGEIETEDTKQPIAGIINLKPQDVSYPKTKIIADDGEGIVLVLKITNAKHYGKTIFVTASFYFQNDDNTCYVHCQNKDALPDYAHYPDQLINVAWNLLSGPLTNTTAFRLQALARLTRRIPLKYDMFKNKKVDFTDLNHENVELATQEELDNLKENNSDEL